MPTLVRTDDVRRQNTRLVMDSLRRLQRVSRTEIVKQTGLSPATISSITSTLISDGILISQEHIGGLIGRGRPRIILSLRPEVGCIVALMLSMNRLDARLQDYAGQTIAQNHLDFDSKSTPANVLFTHIDRLISELLERRSSYPTMPLRYIAVSVQGAVDVARQTLLWSPVMAERDIKIGDFLAKRFKVEVCVDNDCNLLAKALQWRYPEQFGKHFAAILLSQGIGMGLMLDGRLFMGTRTSGNEFGHMVYKPDGAECHCGQRGCIEAYASEYAIFRRLSTHKHDGAPPAAIDEIMMEHFMQQALLQEGEEREAWREAGQAIGYGLRSLFALTDPVPVALVGESAMIASLIEPEIYKILSKPGNNAETEIKLLWYKDADDMIMQGCALVALQAVDHSTQLTAGVVE